MSVRLEPKKTTNVILLLIYLIVRFLFTGRLDELHPYASYMFEALCVGTALAINLPKFIQILRWPKIDLWFCVVALASGIGILRLTNLLQIEVPFDLEGTETLLLLLIVAPILEELIFRFLIWESILVVTNVQFVALICSSVLFSYSHLHAIWFLPPETHNFVFYQTAYTLVLGFACGFVRIRGNSILPSFVLHFLFNLGFYIGTYF